jgi:hypothetical protein
MDAIFAVVNMIVQGSPVSEAFPSTSRTVWDSRPDQKIEFDLVGKEGRYTYQLRVQHDIERDEVVIFREAVDFDSKHLFLFEDGLVSLFDNDGETEFQFPVKGAQSFLSQLPIRPENTLLTSFVNYMSRIWLIKLDPTNISSDSRFESESLDPDGANFAAWYRHFSQERGDTSQLFGNISLALPGFRRMRSVSIGKGGQTRELMVDFEFGRDNGSYEVDFEDLSDGERATIVLYCLLADSENDASADESFRILLLDEPENYVGLQLIQSWLADLSEALSDRGQLFVASHHPEVIDYLAADHTLFFERIDGGPARVREDPFDREIGIRASETMRKGLLDGE